MSMSQTIDNEGKMVSMIMEANKNVRYAAVCDGDGNILWNSHRNNTENILTLEETKASLSRAIETWKKRDELAEKLGKGRYAIVAYDKIKRITIPLTSGNMLFVSVQGNEREYIGDILKIVEWTSTKK